MKGHVKERAGGREEEGQKRAGRGEVGTRWTRGGREGREKARKTARRRGGYSRGGRDGLAGLTQAKGKDRPLESGLPGQKRAEGR